MTVAELIEALCEFPPDMAAYVIDDAFGLVEVRTVKQRVIDDNAVVVLDYEVEHGA